MGLYYDNINDVLYTCSEDKSIKTVENKECTNGIDTTGIIIFYWLFICDKVVKHSDTGLTGMIGDKENKRLFITNRSGVVFIYSINSVLFCF